MSQEKYKAIIKKLHDMTHKAQVLVVGSINRDIFVDVESLPRESRGKTLFMNSTSLEMSDIIDDAKEALTQTRNNSEINTRRSKTELSFGGKGANSAAAAARVQGVSVQMLGAISRDENGKACKKNLEKNGVGTDKIWEHEKNFTTGNAVIFRDEDGHNAIAVSPGANGSLKPIHVQDGSTSSLLASIRRDVVPVEDDIKGVDCIIMQCEISLDTITSTIKKAKDEKKGHNAITVLNAAPAPDDPKAFFKEIKGTGLDYLVVNEHEAAALLGKEIAEGDKEGAKLAAKELKEKAGCKNVLVTLGENGVVLCDESDKVTRVPAVAGIKAVDSTGAGDGFVGSFSAMVAKGCSAKEAIYGANLFAGLSVQKKGTMESYPKREEFLKALDPEKELSPSLDTAEAKPVGFLERLLS